MALTLDNIDSQVNGNIDSKTPTLAAPTAPGAPGSPGDELERLRAENEELKRSAIAAKAAAEDKESELRLKAARAIAHKPVEAVRSNVQQDMAFDQLRRTVGGNCFLRNLTPVEQLEGVGIVGSEQIKDAEVIRFFGRGSDSGAANALRRSDPARYSMLRAIAKARDLY